MNKVLNANERKMEVLKWRLQEYYSDFVNDYGTDFEDVIGDECRSIHYGTMV